MSTNSPRALNTLSPHAAAENRITVRDACTEEAHGHDAGASPLLHRAIKVVCKELGCRASALVVDCDIEVTLQDGTVLRLNWDIGIDGYDYDGSTADAELVQEADRAAQAPLALSHGSAAVAMYAALLKIKALADDAAASVAAAIISTQRSQLRSFDAILLNTQTQCALVTLEALASASASCAKRSAADEGDPYASDWTPSIAPTAAPNSRLFEAAKERREASEKAAALEALISHNNKVLLTVGFKEQLTVIKNTISHARGEGLEVPKGCGPIAAMSAAGIRLEGDAEGIYADFGEVIGTTTVLAPFF